MRTVHYTVEGSLHPSSPRTAPDSPRMSFVDALEANKGPNFKGKPLGAHILQKGYIRPMNLDR